MPNRIKRSLCHVIIFKIFTVSFLREDWLAQAMRLAEFKQLDYIFSKSSQFRPQNPHLFHYSTLRCKWSGFCLIYSCIWNN